MLVNFKLFYNFKSYPTIFKHNTVLSTTQKISRQKTNKQHTFDYKFINTLMRKGNKLKILHIVNKWWIWKYRKFFRYLIEMYIDISSEEIFKKYMDKTQFIEFLKKDYKAWTLSDLLYFRLNTLLSMFQLKQYTNKNLTTWTVTYLSPEKRLNYIYSLFVLHFRAHRLLDKKLINNFDPVFISFFIYNDTQQEVYDIKMQAYHQFLF